MSILRLFIYKRDTTGILWQYLEGLPTNPQGSQPYKGVSSLETHLQEGEMRNEALTRLCEEYNLPLCIVEKAVLKGVLIGERTYLHLVRDHYDFEVVLPAETCLPCYFQKENCVARHFVWATPSRMTAEG